MRKTKFGLLAMLLLTSFRMSGDCGQQQLSCSSCNAQSINNCPVDFTYFNVNLDTVDFSGIGCPPQYAVTCGFPSEYGCTVTNMSVPGRCMGEDVRKTASGCCYQSP